MANEAIHQDYYESSKLAKYPFEPYWPEAKLRICVTGSGGFIASHLAKRLKSEGHYIVGCDWKRNEHMPVWTPFLPLLGSQGEGAGGGVSWHYDRLPARATRPLHESPPSPLYPVRRELRTFLPRAPISASSQISAVIFAPIPLPPVALPLLTGQVKLERRVGFRQGSCLLLGRGRLPGLVSYPRQEVCLGREGLCFAPCFDETRGASRLSDRDRTAKAPNLLRVQDRGWQVHLKP